jgi:hypothetical protein
MKAGHLSQVFVQKGINNPFLFAVGCILNTAVCFFLSFLVQLERCTQMKKNRQFSSKMRLGITNVEIVDSSAQKCAGEGG